MPEIEIDPCLPGNCAPLGSPLPNYYTMLGIHTFEEDRSVIEYAADQLWAEAHARYAAWPEEVPPQILAPILAAKRCLLQYERKIVYDAELWCQLQAGLSAGIGIQESNQGNLRWETFLEEVICGDAESKECSIGEGSTK